MAFRDAWSGRTPFPEPHYVRGIVWPERIVYHHGGGTDVELVQFTQTLTFEALGRDRARLTWHGRIPSAQERARVIKTYNADKGLSQTMARLVDYVVAMATEKTT